MDTPLAGSPLHESFINPSATCDTDETARSTTRVKAKDERTKRGRGPKNEE